MKSINFTHFKDKLISGEKRQTIRCLFIPNYQIKEVVQIKFKKKPLFQAKILTIFPKLIKDITYEESIRDGFLNKEECIKGLMAINKIKSINHYCFIIRFIPILTLDNYLTMAHRRG